MFYLCAAFVLPCCVEKTSPPRNFAWLVLLTARNQFIFCKSPEEACEGAHAIIVLTEWDEFKTYDYKWLEKETGC